MSLMGIFKYEPPVKQIQLASGRKIRYQDNPNFLVYYKFPNMKNVTGMFTEEDDVQITRKIHGTNARYGIVKDAGDIRSANADMSSDKAGERPARRKPKVSQSR